MNPHRQFVGHNTTNLFLNDKTSTANSIEDEFWLMLKSYSNVRSRGVKLASDHGTPAANCLDAWKRFSGYVRIADEFWQTASLSQWQSSALSYYYCFLNLVKAYLVLKDHNMPHRIGHGLSYNPQNPSTAFSRQIISRYDARVTGGTSRVPDSVFKRYHMGVTGRSSAIASSFNVKKLLAYCDDIGYQYSKGGFGQQKTWPFIFKAVNNNTNWWGVLAAPVDLSKQRAMTQQFFTAYEIVATPSTITPEFDRAFPLESGIWPGVGFFQSKNLRPIDQTSVLDLSNEFLALFGGHVEAYLYPGYFSGKFNLRMTLNDSRPMNEELAIYICMYYLSSVVRYKPDYLHQTLGKSENWLLESFVKTCPQKFLRQFVSRIEQRAVILGTL